MPSLGGIGGGKATTTRTTRTSRTSSRSQRTPQQLRQEDQAYTKHMLGKSAEWGGKDMETEQAYNNRMAAKKTFARDQRARTRTRSSLDAQLQGLKR